MMGIDSNQNDNAFFLNELNQINHVSQLFVGLNIYSLLFFQLSGLLNRDRVQSVLVLNGSDPHSIMAMQILIKTLNLSLITCTTDNFENQKFLQDHFNTQQMNIVFTPTERDTFSRCMEITNGLGYDLILDFGGSMSQSKRQVLKLISFYGVIATSYSDMQLDPPESSFLNQKCVTLTFINQSTLIESGLYDGVTKTLLTDLNRKLLQNEYGHVMSQFINANQSGSKHLENQGFYGNTHMGQGMTGVSVTSSSSGSKFKRYSLADLFDEQYGHLQRNELIENQKQEERNLSMHHGNSSSKQSQGAFLNVFVIGD